MLEKSIVFFHKMIKMKKTLVLGASLNPGRYSNIAIDRLVRYRHEVEAVGLKKGTVSGVEISTENEEFENIDTVTLYLNPKRQVEYYDYIISLNPKRVIFNPGTENPELYDLLRKNNIEFEVACTLVLLGTNQY
jgi:predicted CoA-binding protein